MITDTSEATRDAARLALCRRRFLPFVVKTKPNFQIHPHHRLVAAELERFEQEVADGLGPRLIICMPPREGKSEMVSRRYPPWLLGRHPDWNVFVVSYGADLAEDLSTDARAIVQSDAYARIFGREAAGDTTVVELDRGSKSVGHWRINREGGGLYAVGVGGALTGRGFNVGIIDDPTKGRKEADSRGYLEDQWTFYKGTFIDRQEPGAGIVVMTTRWARKDLAGRLLEEMGLDEEDVDQWRLLSIPAEAEGSGDPLGRAPGEFLTGRFTEAQWRRRKANTPERDWLAKFQQRPVPAEGAIFRPYEMFVFADPPRTESEEEYRGPRYGFTDTSYARTRQGDFSALGCWQLEPPGVDRDGVIRPTLGLLDVYRGRYQFPELKRLAKNVYDKYFLWALVIEDYGSGTSLAQEFMRAAEMRIGTYRPDRDKVAAAHSATDVMQSYRIRLPTGAAFPSGLPIRTYVDELANFQGTGDDHDDMVDITSWAMILIGTRDPMNRRKLRQFDFAFGG